MCKLTPISEISSSCKKLQNTYFVLIIFLILEFLKSLRSRLPASCCSCEICHFCLFWGVKCLATYLTVLPHFCYKNIVNISYIQMYFKVELLYQLKYVFIHVSIKQFDRKKIRILFDFQSLFFHLLTIILLLVFMLF